ncbi:polysaccharide pyruvyl transferase family protein [Agromyces albus]|uniref:polysaccharide pyruvyl transferase family protein n=1 Tax=Agromyces albus TaxID=205332 RepID=UPI00278A0C30|nr:pyruvyl transferase [Agromyces albus]
MAVEVIHWNPRRPAFPGLLGRALPVRRPVNNFGDILGPLIVQRITERLGLKEPTDRRRLVAVGSILRLARDGDVVWGTGANGKSVAEPLPYASLDVRAVRGPLTRSYLAQEGITAPEVYGDPGLLIGYLWSREELAHGHAPSDLAVVPNLHDYVASRHHPDVVNPQANVWHVLGRIAASRMVVGSSLHGVVIAESLGIPARLVTSSTEPRFKYDDYYLGTGREPGAFAPNVDSAVRMGGCPPPEWDPMQLLGAFPTDLWWRRSPH